MVGLLVAAPGSGWRVTDTGRRGPGGGGVAREVDLHGQACASDRSRGLRSIGSDEMRAAGPGRVLTDRLSRAGASGGAASQCRAVYVQVTSWPGCISPHTSGQAQASILSNLSHIKV